MNEIKTMNFFSEFNDEQMNKLKSISTQKKYQKGEILFYEGDAPKYLHILLDGALKIYKTNFRSHQVFLHQFLPVSFVAELANFENIAYPATSEFVTSGEVLKIDYEKFTNEFLSDPMVALKMIKSISNKLKIMSEVLHKELILTSEAKIAKFIVENHSLFGILKNVNIASVLNITPETLSRELTKMKNDKLISFNSENKIQHFEKEVLKSLYM